MRGVPAQQDQRPCDMRDVFREDFCDTFFLVEIEIALRQAKTTLREVDRHRRAVLLVLINRDTEERTDLQRSQHKRDIESVARVAHGVDALEFGIQRMYA